DLHHIDEKRKRTLESFKHIVKKSPFSGSEVKNTRKIAVPFRNITKTGNCGFCACHILVVFSNCRLLHVY
ncbi:hypothetical protein GDO81_022559, partial [Engystomops pustulosus]